MKIKSGKEKGASNISLFAVVSAVCFLLSSSVLPYLGSGGKGISPDLLLCLCCLMPKFIPSKSSCVFAVVLGFLSDLFINSPYNFSPVIYLAAVLITPLFYSGFKRVGTVTASVCALCAIALSGAVKAVSALVLNKGTDFAYILVKITFPELLVNFAFTLLTGFILKILCSHFGTAKNI